MILAVLMCHLMISLDARYEQGINSFDMVGCPFDIRVYC